MKTKIIHIIILSLISSLSAYSQERDTSYYRGELDEAIINAQRKKIDETSNFIKLTAPNIKSIPVVLGEVDVLKAIQFTPGIVGGKEGDTGLRIRGGNFDQSLILMDGAPIYNPSHFKGLISSFNPDVLGETNIFKVGFPAKYGGRLSGIVDVAIRDDHKESYHGAITVGLFSSKIYFEGPVIKNVSSFIVSARKSYYDLYLGKLANMASQTNLGISRVLDGMDYYDVNIKYTHNLGIKDKISTSFYIGNDYSNMKNKEYCKYEKDEENTKPNDVMESSYKYTKGDRLGNIASTFHWDHNINSSQSIYTSLTYSEYKSKTHTDTENEIIRWDNSFDYLIEKASFDCGISDLSLNMEYVYDSFKNHTLVTTVGYTLQRLESSVDFLSHKISNYDTLNIDGLNGYKEYLNSFHISLDDQIKVGKKLKVGVGIRINDYLVRNKNYINLDPRIRLEYSPTKKLRFNGSFTIMSQPIHLLSSHNIISRHDLWVPSTELLPPSTSTQGTFGIEYEYMVNENPVIISLEGYYKKMSNILEYIDGGSFASDVEWEHVVTNGDGLAYGAEFFIHKPFGPFTGSLSYTWSKSIRQFEKINGGEWFYDKTDHRHNLTAMMSKKIGKRFLVSLSFQMRSGDWYNLETVLVPYVNMVLGINKNLKEFDDIYKMYGVYEEIFNTVVSGQTASVSLGKNIYQSELYHKMDMSVTYTHEHKFGRSEINLTVANIYNKKNPYYIYCSRIGGTPHIVKVCIFPIMPSISYTYRF